MNPIDIDELLKILPTLIRESDIVKGAILTALSGVLATRDDIQELIKRMDKRFEAMQQQMDKRFEAMQQQMDKRFEAMQQQMNKRFDGIDAVLNEIKAGIGRPFEQFARNVVTRILQAEGVEQVRIDKTILDDPKQVVFPNSTEVEIDGLCLVPPVIIEITSILKDKAKIAKFLRKKSFVESHYNKKFRGFFVAASSQFKPEEIATITVELHKNNSELINL